MKNILRHIVVMLTTYLILTLFIVRNLLSTTNFILTELGDLIWSYLMIIAISIENFYFVLIIILYIGVSRRNVENSTLTILPMIR